MRFSSRKRLAAIGVFSLCVALAGPAANSANSPKTEPQPAADKNVAAEVQKRLSQITEPFQVPDGPVDEDGQLLSLAEDLPGFAGMWSDGEGDDQTVTVAFTPDTAKGMTPEQITDLIRSYDIANLRAVGAVDAIVEGAPVKIVERTYPFALLKQWQELASDKLNTPLVFTDADERNNTVTIGVADEKLIASVEEAAVLAGIPKDAIRVVHADIQVTLRDDHRPVAGGQQIEFIKPFLGDLGWVFSGYNCTLGVNGRITNLVEPINGFFTNSHCSIDYAEVDYVYHWQPSVPFGALWNTENRIGYEIIDPPLYTGNPYSDPTGSVNCPSGIECRMSDAAFSMYDEDYENTSRGRIARPSTLNDPNAWNGTNTYRITNVSAPTGGVRAVGRTSGMSTGTIVQSCVRVYVTDFTDIAQNCSYIGSYSSEGGDSGGPVFRVTNSPSGNDVTFVGLNWGGGTINGEPFGAASSWPLMQTEFAPFNIAVCQSAYTC